MKKLPKKFSRQKKDVFTYKHEKQIQGVPDQNLHFQMTITQSQKLSLSDPSLVKQECI